MNMQIVSHSNNNNNNAGINRKISIMMMGQYKKGLDIKNNDLAIESGETEPDVVNPTQTIRVAKVKGKPEQKGYSIKDVKKYTSTNNALPVGTNVKEFVKQSRVLDNELDQVVAMLKLNNKDEFYKGRHVVEEGAGMLVGGKLQREKWVNKSSTEIKERQRKLLTELQNHDASSPRGMEIQDDDIEYLESLLHAISEPSSAVEEKSEAEPPAINVDESDTSPIPSEVSPMPPGDEYEKLLDEDKDKLQSCDVEELQHFLKKCATFRKKLKKESLDTTDINEDIEFLKWLIDEKKHAYHKFSDEAKEDYKNETESKIAKDITKLKKKLTDDLSEGRNVDDLQDDINYLRSLIQYNKLSDESKDASVSEFKAKINADIKRLEKQFDKYKKRGEDTSDIEEDIDYLKSVLHIKNKDLHLLMQKKGRYDQLSPKDKEFMDRAIDMIKNPKPETEDALKNLGYDIDRARDERKGHIHKLTVLSRDNLIDSYTGKNKDLKSKKGIRVISNTDVTNIPADIIVIIKKITNVITATLLPMAQTLYDSRFRGLQPQDKITIITLYAEMDEKMYILTSINSSKNAQLIKLDKEFDKLYSLVKSGMDLFVPASYTGGSMKPLITNHLCLL